MALLEHYSYLWDGSDPGWVVLRIHRQIAELALTFPLGDPSVQDIAAVRAAIPRFAEMPPAQVRSELNGPERIPLGKYEHREAKRLSDQCAARGLTVELIAIDASSLVPYHEGRKASLIIEDDSLATSICETAIARGLRVVQVEA